MTAPNQSNYGRYEWDARSTVETNMTETPLSKLAMIWLRRPKIFWLLFLSVSQSQVCRIEKRKHSLTVLASLGQGVSALSV